MSAKNNLLKVGLRLPSYTVAIPLEERGNKEKGFLLPRG